MNPRRTALLALPVVGALALAALPADARTETPTRTGEGERNVIRLESGATSTDEVRGAYLQNIDIATLVRDHLQE